MEASKDHIIPIMDEVTVASKRGTKRYNPGLRALLSIKNFSTALEKEYSELLQVENQLNEAYKNGLLIVKSNTLPEETDRWESVIKEVNNSISNIHDTLAVAKAKVGQEEKNSSPEFWKEVAAHLTAFQENSKNAGNTGYKILPEAIHPLWETDFVKPETTLRESFIFQVDSYRVLLQMIDMYTPEEFNAITRMIADHVPADFTYEEALDYQNDYYKALVNFKNEFKKEKNLWDKFLDILAGGTHQTPSERVMMERWVDGESETKPENGYSSYRNVFQISIV